METVTDVHIQLMSKLLWPVTMELRNKMVDTHLKGTDLGEFKHLALIKTAVCCGTHAITHIVTRQRQKAQILILISHL